MGPAGDTFAVLSFPARGATFFFFFFFFYPDCNEGLENDQRVQMQEVDPTE